MAGVPKTFQVEGAKIRRCQSIRSEKVEQADSRVRVIGSLTAIELVEDRAASTRLERGAKASPCSYCIYRNARGARDGSCQHMWADVGGLRGIGRAARPWFAL